MDNTESLMQVVDTPAIEREWGIKVSVTKGLWGVSLRQEMTRYIVIESSRQSCRRVRSEFGFALLDVA